MDVFLKVNNVFGQKTIFVKAHRSISHSWRMLPLAKEVFMGLYGDRKFKHWRLSRAPLEHPSNTRRVDRKFWMHFCAAERYASGAAGSRSEAEAGSRRLHALVRLKCPVGPKEMASAPDSTPVGVLSAAPPIIPRPPAPAYRMTLSAKT